MFLLRIILTQTKFARAIRDVPESDGERKDIDQ